MEVEMSLERQKFWRDDRTAKLLEAMLQGTIPEVKPEFNPESELGFSFPAVSRFLGITDEEALAILESLADAGVLERKFFDKFLYCPQCRSVNLRPGYYCPNCSVGEIGRARILEHSLCKYVGAEDEFSVRGKLICPKCKQELYTLDTDYRSLGVFYKCYQCGEIFNQPAIRWRCLKCFSVTAENRVLEENAYSYCLNEEQSKWLQFELRPKSQLVDFLARQGYKVTEGAAMMGRSGAKHTFDLLATRDDGVVVHNIVIGVEVAGKKVGLDRVFDFADKAYDCGIHDKILLVLPVLEREAERFASEQRIRVVEVRDLDSVLAVGRPPPPVEAVKEPFQFKSMSHLMAHLQALGYEVKPQAKVKGKSGAEHQIDVLATRDDGIVVHKIAIGVETGDKPVGLDRVFDFDDKAYDTGIVDKVLIAVPGLATEASRFARRQRIRVFEAAALEPGEQVQG
jgi:predicted RNA-binding Zn-ribbon protein involved in translation (DUF1610 family)